MAETLPEEWRRYERQLALPEMTLERQKKLARTCIAMVGAGGLGAAALPYLAGAGVDNITIYDHDKVELNNLHRQTVFTTAQVGQYKANLMRDYLQNLNSEINIFSGTERITPNNALEKFTEGPYRYSDPNYDLILDGSDNFETKVLLNQISIQTETPLISASVERFEATIGIFSGFAADKPCYACLFPTLPEDACNCDEAGVLGTVAGLAGLYQAHLALCFLLGIGEAGAGSVLKLDFKTLRLQHLKLGKDPACGACAEGTLQMPEQKPDEDIPVFSFADLAEKDHVLIDVRSPEEVLADPVPGALHIPLQDLATRTEKIPSGKLVALTCQKGIRSKKAALMLREFGFDVCVLNRFL